MPFPALPSWRQRAIGPTPVLKKGSEEEALAHETTTTEVIAEAAE
jgi:hypothetical protein